MNATDNNEEESYSLSSPTAPHAATANDDITLIFLSAAADDSFLHFLFNCCRTNLTDNNEEKAYSPSSPACRR